MPKVKVKTTTVKAPDRYAPFGELADTFKGQGWIPERYNNEFTEYRPNYGLLNSVDLGAGNKGYFSIRGGNTNGVFDLFIKDANGNTVGHPLLTGVNAKQVNDYFTNYNRRDNYGNALGSNVNVRSGAIQGGADPLTTVAFKK